MGSDPDPVFDPNANRRQRRARPFQHRDANQRLKAEPGKDLIKYGTSRVDDTLLRAQLVDELRLWVMPVVVGTGQRLFDDIDTSSLQLTLTDARELANGSAILSYTPSYRT